jgi:hypothetical protein
LPPIIVFDTIAGAKIAATFSHAPPTPQPIARILVDTAPAYPSALSARDCTGSCCDAEAPAPRGLACLRPTPVCSSLAILAAVFVRSITFRS